MNNLECLMKDKELLKSVLIRGLAIYNGKPVICTDIDCKNCDLNVPHHHCSDQRKEWLEAKYEPLYKKGDIVIYDSRLFVVAKDECNGVVTVSRFVHFVGGSEVSINCIGKKVGSIYDDVESEEK